MLKIGLQQAIIPRPKLACKCRFLKMGKPHQEKEPWLLSRCREMSLPFCCVFLCVSHSSSWTQTANRFDQNALFFFLKLVTEDVKEWDISLLFISVVCCKCTVWINLLHLSNFIHIFDLNIQYVNSPTIGAPLSEQNKTCLLSVVWSRGWISYLATWGAFTLSYPYRAQEHLTGLWGSNLLGHSKGKCVSAP